ncbi:putative fructosyl amino acid oxidase [Lepidopterella palustris CBS 459.81]|uniref:Putative fructosyl amino acid oxidase n=1 Tax=Lepidopterella palustris CBS 459.81 TaxID=1314670 RepID=A0A8E2DZ86_9PEZI|nr:putative fructosyl amino acid oxidase [Lepidopterella palustris CBS 459.81]
MAVPASIIVVGSGVFGLSTAYAMSRDARFADTKLVLVDRWDFEPDSATSSVQNPGAANADTSRIIRRDYPHGPYAALACEAREHWRAEFGENNRYVEQRLLFSAEGCSLERPKKDGETINYIKNAYALSCEITPNGKDGLKILDSLSEIRSELGISSSLPRSLSAEEDKEINRLRGYISDDCGWANAGVSIEWLRQQVIRLGRVEFRTGQVENLVFTSDKQQVQGVRLVDGAVITADLTIIAAGSQSPHILGMPNLCDVYSEVVAYIQLSEDEADELRRRNWPLIVNAHRGVFTTGPDHDNCLKLGHFSHSGMVDVLRSAGIELGSRTDMSESSPDQQWKNPNFGWGGDVTLSERGDVVDYESDKMLKTLADYRVFLLELLGPSALEGWSTRDHDQAKSDSVLNSIAVRPFARVRKCWYTDTPSLDFIVDYHPSYGKSLFVATGGNDHAFKFLPIIGEKVIAIALHHRGVASASPAPQANPSVEELCHLWRFPVELLK